MLSQLIEDNLWYVIDSPSYSTLHLRSRCLFPPHRTRRLMLMQWYTLWQKVLSFWVVLISWTALAWGLDRWQLSFDPA